MARPRHLPLLGALNVLPIPGAAAAWLGWRNPHTRLLGHGAVQALLVLFGSWPLIVPGAIGLAWAAWDGARIARAEAVPPPPRPDPAAPDEPTL